MPFETSAREAHAPRARRWLGWPLVALSTVLVLGGVNLISWHVYRHAAAVLDGSLDDRLVAIGRATVPHLEGLITRASPPRLDDASRHLAYLRGTTELEQAFVVDRDFLALADARATQGATGLVDLMRLDPDALERAWSGEVAPSPRYEIEGMLFKGAYLPLRDEQGQARAVLYLEANLAFVQRLASLRDILVVVGVLSAALSLVMAVMVTLGLRAVTRATERRSREGHLATMGRLAAEVAHEIKNPLGTVLGCADVLEERYFLPAGGKTLLDDLRAEVRRVNALVEEFLALSPEIEPVRRPHDLDQLVGSVLDRVALAKRDRLPTIERRLGPITRPAHVDANRLRQALLNLVLNAVQALDGRGTLTVVTREISPDEFVIEVIDDGPGMPPEVLRQAFDPFYSTKPGGSGLGLSIARNLVEGHGGNLKLTSQPGRGTRCEIRMPFGSASASGLHLIDTERALEPDGAAEPTPAATKESA